MPTIITPADATNYLDLLGSAWLRSVGTQTTGYGMASTGSVWGGAGAIADLKELIQTVAATSLDPVADLSPAVVSLATRFDGPTIAADQMRDAYAALQAHVVKAGLAGVGNLDQWLTYYNCGSGGPWNALQSGQLTSLFARWQGTAYGLSRHNFYFEILQGASYANALAKSVVTGAGTGTFTAGFSIDGGIYAGGFPNLKISSLVGSGTIVVTGTAFDPATKAPIENVKWKAVLAGGETSAALVPNDTVAAPANSLILVVSSITIPAGVSGGTIWVEAHRPPGRSVLPL